MYKNIESQVIAVYAYDTSGGDTPKTGDAGNITAYISKDGGAAAQSNDANPTERDGTNMPGVYIFDLLQAETNCDHFVIKAKSSTGNVEIKSVAIETQEVIENAVWDTARTDHTDEGTFGENVPTTDAFFMPSHVLPYGVATDLIFICTSYNCGTPVTGLAFDGEGDQGFVALWSTVYPVTLYDQVTEIGGGMYFVSITAEQMQFDKRLFMVSPPDGKLYYHYIRTVGDTDSADLNISDEIWDALKSNHTTASTFGKSVADIEADTDGIKAVTDVLPDSGALDDLALILADTGTDGVVLATNAITAAKIATDAIDADALKADAIDLIWDEVMEGSLTARQIKRIVLAVLAGISTGGGTTTIAFRNIADDADRVSATVDSEGNRDAIVLDGS